MCDELIKHARHHEKLDTLKQIERLLLAATKYPPIDQTVQFSATQPYIVDYKERRHIYVWLPVAQAVSMEDYGSGTLLAQVWINLGLQEGTRIFATGSSTTVPMIVRCSDEVIP